MEKYDVWLATKFSLPATSSEDATARAKAWLTAMLDTCTPPEQAAIDIVQPAQNLADAAVLALQLLGIEREGGQVEQLIARLRAEVAQQNRIEK